jgi:histidinol-phosphate aminotransferase
MNLNQWIRPHVRELIPYSSARDEYSGKVGTFLDANENSLGSVGGGSYNRYPDPHQRAIKARLAKIKGVSEEQIFLGNGSDEAIDLLFRVFCEPGEDHVLLNPPTYGMYKVSAEINGVAYREILLTENYQLDLERLLPAMEAGPKLTFLCSPNNPTGNLLKREDVAKVLAQQTGIVVVDEAYADFAPEGSWLPLLNQHPNLVVLQTFSKAWGLAGLRLGMAYAHPEIIAALNRIKPPYNVNQLTQEVVLAALEKQGEKEAMVKQILSERENLAEALGALQTVEKVYPTDANFVLVKVPAPNLWYQKLIDRRIIIRNRSRVALCEGCLRITIGTPVENEALLQALRAFEREKSL